MVLATCSIGLAIAPLPGISHAAQQSAPSDTGKIKKCQDTAGQWHYGDKADEACSQSKIIEINKRGVETKQIAAPLTPEEIQAKEGEKQAQQQKAQADAERARKDKILVSSYANENDLNAMRDRKLGEIDMQIRGSQETLTAQQTSLARLEAKAKDEGSGGKPVSAQTQTGIDKTRAVIAKQEIFIQTKQQEREKVNQQFQADLERFRQLKTRPVEKP
jgi:hypothetical protein